MDNLQESTPSKWAGERMKNGNAKQTVETKAPRSGKTLRSPSQIIDADKSYR